MTFIDFKKAFDLVNRKAMWKILRNMKYLKNSNQIIKCLYDGNTSAGRVDGILSKRVLGYHRSSSRRYINSFPIYYSTRFCITANKNISRLADPPSRIIYLTLTSQMTLYNWIKMKQRL